MSSTCLSLASLIFSLAFAILPLCSIGLSSSCEIRVVASAKVPMPACYTLPSPVACDAI
ncbi:hypothetical protein BJY00DRAFT_297186 [Aspergillus carlsbadensis]|nr:hypothetical protein BJY00DRAFT_297186 [Aspergillus carlsbadensis]